LTGAGVGIGVGVGVGKRGNSTTGVTSTTSGTITAYTE